MNAPIGKLMGRDLYVANKAKLKPEDLVPYHGRWVAWSQEGDRVVAHGSDPAEVLRTLERLGVSTESVVFDRIPEGGEPEGIL